MASRTSRHPRRTTKLLLLDYVPHVLCVECFRLFLPWPGSIASVADSGEKEKGGSQRRDPLPRVQNAEMDASLPVDDLVSRLAGCPTEARLLVRVCLVVRREKGFAKVR